MEQPSGFEAPGKEDWVMHLMKSIYGMKQASWIWNLTFHETVKGWGFECLPCEWCVYQHQSATGTVIFAIYVDDFISATSSPEENEAFKAQLSLKWEISALGPAKFALGIAITCDTSLHTVTISQGALIDCIVEKFRLFDAHPVDTPMVAGLQLRRPDKLQPIDGELAAWLKCTPY